MEDKINGDRFEYLLQLNKNQLENIMSRGICPFTLRCTPRHGSYDMSGVVDIHTYREYLGKLISPQGMADIDTGDRGDSFKCGVDGGIARGGKVRESGISGAFTPCSIDYAMTCPLYKSQTIPIKNETNK